jgi:hypothetical protein
MVRISSRVSQTAEEEHATTAVKNIGASCQHVAVMPKWDVAPAFPSGLCASLPPCRSWRTAAVLQRVSSPRQACGASPVLSPRRSGGRSRPAAARAHTPDMEYPSAESQGGAEALATKTCVFPIPQSSCERELRV